MKKLVVVLFILTSFSINSQIIVAKYRFFEMSPNKNDLEQIEILKQKKTLFILPSTYSLGDYEKVIKSVWNITPVEVVISDNFDAMKKDELESKYAVSNYSYFRLTSTTATLTSTSGRRTDYIFNKMDLNVYKFKKKNNKGKEIFDDTPIATIFFTPSIEQRKNNLSAREINPSEFINFNLGYLKDYLKIVNNKLISNAYLSCFDDINVKNNLKNLKTKTLFIPASIGVKYNPALRTEGKKRDSDELLADYSFNYEVITDEELNKKILDGEEIYYLQYSQITSYKLISVIDNKNSEVIYNSKENMSYNIKANDFKELSKAILKS